MTTTDDLISERNRTHGLFHKTARVAQELKVVLDRPGDEERPPYVSEGLDMICTKLSRIVAGTWDYADHWDDVAGYAKMVADRLRLAPLHPRVAEGLDRIDERTPGLPDLDQEYPLCGCAGPCERHGEVQCIAYGMSRGRGGTLLVSRLATHPANPGGFDVV